MHDLIPTFHDYMRGPVRDISSPDFIKLQKQAREIITIDDNSNWMDDTHTALIIHHILRMEMNEAIRGDSVWRAFNQALPFLNDAENIDLIAPYIQRSWKLPAEHTHELTDQDLPMVQIGIHVTPHSTGLVGESIPTMERFLERERALFGNVITTAIFELPADLQFSVRSERPGHWICALEGAPVDTDESTFEGIAHWILDTVEDLKA